METTSKPMEQPSPEALKEMYWFLAFIYTDKKTYGHGNLWVLSHGDLDLMNLKQAVAKKNNTQPGNVTLLSFSQISKEQFLQLKGSAHEEIFDVTST